MFRVGIRGSKPIPECLKQEGRRGDGGGQERGWRERLLTLERRLEDEQHEGEGVYGESSRCTSLPPLSYTPTLYILISHSQEPNKAFPPVLAQPMALSSPSPAHGPIQS